jgi:hypothetical protein
MDSEDTDFIEVYRARNSAQAHLLANELQNAGFTVQVDNDLLQGALGDIPVGWSTAPRLLVPRSQALRARALLEYREAELIQPPEEADPDEGVRCLACGKTIPDDEDTCPACGWSYSGVDEGTP